MVDDSGVVRLSILKILKKEGFNAFEATNIKTVKQSSFAKDLKLSDIDIIFLDIYLKGESGFDILEFLTSNYPQIYVVMLTGESKKEIVQKAVELGAKDYIIKPFDKETILNKVNQILDLKEIKSGEKKAVSGSQNNIKGEDLFKENLFKEVDRTIRTGKAFSIIELNYNETFEDDFLEKITESLNNEMRDIDQFYIRNERSIILILPVTVKSGIEVVLDKITNIIKEVDSNSLEKIDFKSATFPDDFYDENKNLEYDNNDKYIGKILEKF